MLNELNKNHMGGFENYGHEELYNIDDAWEDTKADIKPKVSKPKHSQIITNSAEVRDATTTSLISHRMGISIFIQSFLHSLIEHLALHELNAWKQRLEYIRQLAIATLSTHGLLLRSTTFATETLCSEAIHALSCPTE